MGIYDHSIGLDAWQYKTRMQNKLPRTCHCRCHKNRMYSSAWYFELSWSGIIFLINAGSSSDTLANRNCCIDISDA